MAYITPGTSHFGHHYHDIYYFGISTAVFNVYCTTTLPQEHVLSIGHTDNTAQTRQHNLLHAVDHAGRLDQWPTVSATVVSALNDLKQRVDDELGA